MNNDFYFTRYLKEIVQEDILDHIKFEIDKSIYYYGAQFKTPRETTEYTNSLKSNIKYLLWIINKLSNKTNINKSKENLVSNAYFGLDSYLRDLGYSVHTPPWYFNNYNISIKEKKLINDISNKLLGNVNYLISDDFFNKIKELESLLVNFYTDNNIKATFFPYDISFFENVSIKVLKNLNIKSFVFLHGLPGIYNSIDNFRGSYVLVWGEKIKENFIEVGCEKNKIHVVGHPSYKNKPNFKLSNNFNSITIITKSCSGGQHGNYEKILYDRGNSILYLFSIQKTLKKLGITNVKLRLHPSENSDWYYKFIDSSFFILDKQELTISLKNSSLVIGPTSTVMLESLYYGVNYVVYEPVINGVTLTSEKVFPPFDGSDPRLPVAKNEEELYELLSKKVLADLDIFNDYIKTPFNIDIVRDLI